MKSKGFCLALVCVSMKFIDFIFLVSLKHTLKEKQRKIFKNKQQKRKQKKNKTKQNKTKQKQKQNPH